MNEGLMCHGGWVSDVEMLGENMSRLGERVLATTGHTSSRTARIADNGQGGLVDGDLRSSIDLRSDNTANSGAASLLSACRKRAARRFERSATRSRMQVTTIELSKIMYLTTDPAPPS